MCSLTFDFTRPPTQRLRRAHCAQCERVLKFLDVKHVKPVYTEMQTNSKELFNQKIFQSVRTERRMRSIRSRM